MNVRYLALAILLAMLSENGAAQQVIILTDSTEVPELNLKEIRVSASKTNVSLKKLPASVTLVSGKTLRQNEVNTLADISALTPGFFMPDYGSRLTSPVYIRGIGSQRNSPSVGLYVDNVPYFEKAAYNFDFFDVERIEVLKGPQGTLYGRNTMGGMINVITRSPLSHQGTSLGISGGMFGDFKARVSHYGKAGENLGYSIAAYYRHREGYYTNTFLNEQVDQSDNIGLRSKLVWRISDRLKLENITTLDYVNEGGYPYAIFNDSLMRAEQINYNQPSSYIRSMFSNAMVLSYSGNGVAVKSTTSFQYLDDLQEIDQDFSPDSSYFVSQDQAQHMVSTELTVRSDNNSRFNWLFGAYGFRQLFDKHVDVHVYRNSMVLFREYDHVIQGGALFHQSTLNDLFIKGLTLTAGVRLDLEQDILDYHYDRSIAGARSSVSDTVYPALSYDQILPKVALNYQMGKSSFYGVIAKGYKTGGFNSTFYRPDDLSFGPETSYNYEMGVKTALFNSMAYLDASLFYIDWTNQQISQTALYPDSTYAPGSVTRNAGESVSWGGELTLKSMPVYGITPVIAYGYTNASFTNYKENESTDYTGNRIPYIPKQTLTLQLKKEFPVKRTGFVDKINVSAIYRGLGDIYWTVDNYFKTGYYQLLDMKVAFVKKEFSFEIWGKNLLNQSYESYYFQALGNEYVQVGKPLRFGVNIHYNF